MYGGGPSVSPQLYSSSDRAKFRIESGALFDILRNGRRVYRFSKPSMPVEFQTGTYRFGHSIVRPS
ncbi:MAG: hypothetical protein ACRDS0_00785 [Pseudonocardiaceae bacterium]